MAGHDLPRLHKASWTFRSAECYPREPARAYPPPTCLSLARLPAPLAPISHATRPEEKKLASLGSNLLQTAIIKRSGQSNLHQNRKDEEKGARMDWKPWGGYLDAIEDET